MSEMSDKTAVDMVGRQLRHAQLAVETALLWPAVLSAENFHDLKNIIEILKDIVVQVEAT